MYAMSSSYLYICMYSPSGERGGILCVSVSCLVGSHDKKYMPDSQDHKTGKHASHHDKNTNTLTVVRNLP
jgi:hypothetical protein